MRLSSTGVWAIAPLTSWNRKESCEPWIEVRDSQWKFEDQQTNTFTYELHSIPGTRGQSAKLVSFLYMLSFSAESIPLIPSQLSQGKQMFEVLAHCGVPTKVFREMLRSQVETSEFALFLIRF